ncbi:DUF4349 domain-containing protein [Eubacteriales bacterium OttesenSCG-928-K08]|nr:DUF4349 domain-containing protein [Eubacteriales bacterium OttesenSCG-928-K08]
MKKHQRQWTALLLLAIMLVLAGCSAKGGLPQTMAATENWAYDQAAPAAEAPMPTFEPEIDKSTASWDGVDYDSVVSEEGEAVAGGAAGHKIIKTANLGMESRQFEELLSYINEKTQSMGGYVSYSHTSGRKPENYYDSGRYASITIRIPQKSMESFISDARALEFATVTNESRGGEDITSSYYDSESRLTIYTTQRDRILALLEQADTMEDIIALESELSRLTYEIEALTTQLRRWDDLIDFATVSIDIREIAPNAPVASNDTFGTRISEGFARTLSGIAVFFENAAVFLIIASPVIILLGIIAAVVLLIIRSRGKKKKKAREKLLEENKASENTPGEE